MNQRKKRIRIVITGMLCCLIAGFIIYWQFIRVQNIFDEMYYARVQTYYDDGRSFGQMPQIEPVTRDEERFYRSDGEFYNYYEKEYLREGEKITIICSQDRGLVRISAVKKLNEFKIFYRYSYYVRTKQMEEKVKCQYGEKYGETIQEVIALAEEAGLTKKDLMEYKQYFLYDKLLTDWLSVNSSRFSVNRWGNVEFIEVLPMEVR